MNRTDPFDGHDKLSGDDGMDVVHALLKRRPDPMYQDVDSQAPHMVSARAQMFHALSALDLAMFEINEQSKVYASGTLEDGDCAHAVGRLSVLRAELHYLMGDLL